MNLKLLTFKTNSIEWTVSEDHLRTVLSYAKPVGIGHATFDRFGPE